MLAALGAAIAKDLRLLGRDRAGLVFLSLAPVLVITVAPSAHAFQDCVIVTGRNSPVQ